MKRKQATLILQGKREAPKEEIQYSMATMTMTATWQLITAMRSIGSNPIHLATLWAKDGEILVNIASHEICGFLKFLSLSAQHGKIDMKGFGLGIPDETLLFFGAHGKELNNQETTKERRMELLKEFFINQIVVEDR